MSSDDDADRGRTHEQPPGLETGTQCWRGKRNPTPRTKQMNGRDDGEPDTALFLPRAVRERGGATRAASSRSFSEESRSDNTGETLTANRDELSDSSDHVTRGDDAFVKASHSGPGPGPCPPSWDLPVSYFRAMSWDCGPPGDAWSKTHLPALEPRINGDYISEIATNLKEQDVVILSAQNDYSCYENAWVDADAFGHVLEIYNISPTFKTQDLMDALAEFSAGGLKIHRVDHAHALAVFPCTSAALRALSLTHPSIRVRNLSRGSRKSRAKALRLAELLRPLTEETHTGPSLPSAEQSC
ncbi:uncharacterized protein LOC133140899 [Conger conger]|uniref:uncharacterized protein LOC133140899 n=1 Tax=Conger conger TaxID=82655 RepID=UPI002A59C12C|nr:uncharacterized protein LOC133140899 [Conger conger]XP_061117171.1 uncharacterized protein LOC133140899 [Conger conger]